MSILPSPLPFFLSFPFSPLPFLSLPPLPFLLFFPLPLPLRPSPSLRSMSLLFQLEALEERCSTPSGVWDGAPAEIDFGAF